MSRATVSCAVVMLLAACAPAATTTTSAFSSPVVQASGTHNLLTGPELMRYDGALTLYEVVGRLRPHFLEPRTPALTRGRGRGAVAVYLDGTYAGELEVLRLLHAEDVRSIELVQMSQAYVTMGSAHGASQVLLVRMWR